LVSASRSAHAGVVFDPISKEFTDATTGWMQNSYELGTHIFLSIAAVMLIYNIVSYYLQYESLQGIGSVIVRSVLGIALPYGILQAAPTLLNNIVGTAGQLLGKINGGSTPLPAAVATGNTVSPDSLALLGIELGWKLPTTAFSMMAKMGFQSMNITNLNQTFSGNAHQAIVDLILGLATMLSGFGILLAFWYIAAELLTAYIEVSFVAPLGAWALGFMAAPATTAIAESYGEPRRIQSGWHSEHGEYLARRPEPREDLVFHARRNGRPSVYCASYLPHIRQYSHRSTNALR
jgi:hypothetical protein